MGNQRGMVTRFTAAFGLTVLYMIAWVPPLCLWITIWGDNDVAIAVGVMVEMVICMIGFIPYLNLVAKKVFYCAGEGEPVPGEELRTMIKEINGFDVPVAVQERGNTLVVTWRYVDAKWWEILARAGLKQVYELHIKFNEAKKEATLIDVHKSVSWRAGPSQVQVYGGFFRGISFAYEIGKAWGIKENFALGSIYDYRFSPQEIKNPVMNSILRNGWAVRFGMW